MDLIDIKKLARLARLAAPDEELESVAKDMAPILKYVAQVQEVSGIVGIKNIPSLINRGRDDQVTTETGIYSQVLLDEAPVRDGEYLKVKKIL